MTWSGLRSVLIISDDPRLLELVATELQELGCRVFCARDLEGAVRLVRAGVATRFVLVRLGADRVSARQLRGALAAELAGRSLRHGDGDATGAAADARQLPN